MISEPNLLHELKIDNVKITPRININCAGSQTFSKNPPNKVNAKTSAQRITNKDIGGTEISRARNRRSLR